MSRDRESIRTRERLTLSGECLDYDHGDCTSEECQCPCHRLNDEEEIDESP
jgi:hypothetical protein